MDIYKPTDEQQNQFIWKDPLPSIIDFGHNLRRMGLVNVVELGCRVGGHAVALSELGLNVTAVDRNKSNLNIVSGRAHSKQCKIATIHQTSTRLPFEDNTVHAFVTSTAIHHLNPSEAKEMVNEIYRTLIPGGRIIVAVLSVEDYRYGTGKKIDENTFENTIGPEIKNLHQFFTEESLLNLFNSFISECKPYIVSSTYTLNVSNHEYKQGKLLIGKFMKGISLDITKLKSNVMLDNLKNAKRSIELHFTYSTINRNEFISSCLKFLESLTVDFLKKVHCQCIIIGNCSLHEVLILKKLGEFKGIDTFSLAYSEHNTETQSLNIAIIDGVTVYCCTHSENFFESSLIFKSDPELIILLRQHLTFSWKKSSILIDNGKNILGNDSMIQFMGNESCIETSIENVDLRCSKKDNIRIGIVQINLTKILYFDYNSQLLIPDVIKLSNTIENILLKAANMNINFLLLPELSGDVSLDEKLQAYATDNNMIIIGGSYYNHLRVNCCPVFFPGMHMPYVIEKVHPSPFELSPNKNAGAVEGKKTIVFKNTTAGSFGVLICADYLNDTLVENICNKEIDFLCVLSMNNDSNRFFEKMNSRCQNCQRGIYILYSNCLFSTDIIKTDGLSSIFGFMDRIFLNKLKREETKYPYQITSFSSTEGEGLLLADINLNEKRPSYLTSESKPNISGIDKILFDKIKI